MSISSQNRREFLRIIGGLSFTSVVAPGYVLGAASKGSQGVLVEASAFANLGGWKLDTQHYQQMGGSYLLAHGMGKPVENATTTVDIPEAGDWHVWVRNRDWCPGEWQAPGRFEVMVNGQKLDPTFGAAKADWHWEDGGKVKIDKAGKVEVVLKDLTGFDGRCDAIFFTKEEKPTLPNNDLRDVSAWKDQVTGRADQKIEEHDFDLVIVGGGMSGCGAALAAREKGLKVALIQDRPLFGGNASEEIRVHTLGIHGYGHDLIGKIDTAHYPNGHADAIKDQALREASMKASGVSLFAHHIACGLEKDGDQIASVEAREVTSGVIKRFRAPVFIDASGDGWLGFWGGAEIREGREAYSEYNEQWDKHGDLWSPKVADNKVMGTSVLWNAEQTNERHDFPEVPWALPVAKNHEALKGEWYWEYSDNDLDQIDDAEQIRDHVLRAIYGSFYNAKQQPKNAPWKLKFVAHVGGKRCSRRIVGDYVYSMRDASEKKEFEDAVVVERRDIDTHFQRKETGDPLDFLSKA
ncbi:MAG: FAD-dependent oxidoreductase, partial [Verrucomicrobiota bacterium]